MKFKTLLVAALCAANLYTVQAAPSSKTKPAAKPIKPKQPVKPAKPATPVKPKQPVQPAQPVEVAAPEQPEAAPVENETAGNQGNAVVVINDITRNDSQADAALPLARNGRALLPIVISAKASDALKATAADLAEYLGKIAGATFEVEVGDGSSGIVVGNMTDFPMPDLAEALEIKNGFDGKEAFAIRTHADRVLLLGATDLGASHAASRFLEVLGYRHFFPHSAWEVIPSTPDLQWNRDITDRPQMLARTIWFEAGSGTENAAKDYQEWKRHNLAAESFQVYTGHNLTAVLDDADNRAKFNAHPEYFPLIKQADGTMKRDPSGSQLELGNPEVRKMIAQYAVNFFKQYPNADMVSIEPADTNNYSQSPESLAMGSISDQVYSMANQAARALKEAYPGQNKMVGLLSYNSTYDPPTFKLEPNVHVQMASIGVNPTIDTEERRRVWPQLSSNLGVYEYYSVWLWSNDKLPGSYTNNVRESQRHIRDELVGLGVTSMSAESTSSWGSNGRGYYVANKLMWNPDLDLDALLDDFYTQAFGPAARDMKKYYDRLDPGSNPLMSDSLLGQAFRDVDNASKAARNRPDVMARIDQIKLYLRYVDLMWFRDQGGQVEENAIMNNLFRTREYALTAWSMISQNWAGGIRVDKEYTRDEIETGFQEGVARYRAKIRDDLMPRQTFSQDLVAVNWPDVKPTDNNVASTQTYQGTMRYVLQSLNGEPLEFTTEASDAWGYKTEYKVTDVAGKVLAEGKPASKVLLTHKIEVPGPGIYYLNYYDPGAYWTFAAKPGLPYSIVVLPEVATARGTTGLPQIYFYVPKDTEKIEYFATPPHKIYGPDGSEQKIIATANDWITIPVPAGMDGKLWMMRDLYFGKFYFSNIPSYFSPTPEGVVVPREIAEKDELEIRK